MKVRIGSPFCRIKILLTVILLAFLVRMAEADVRTVFGDEISETAASAAQASDKTSSDTEVSSIADLSGYQEFVYDISSGMSSSEANAIAETEDGYIWIGSYAGLTRYDGQEFEYIHVSGIASVTALLTDSEGRLWVGTNDGGVARYENGEFCFFTVEDGLSANSVRSFAEASDGTMFVGTTDRICKVDSSDHISILSEDITYVNSMLAVNGTLIGATNAGLLFAVPTDGDGEALFLTRDDGSYYTSVASTSLGLLAGTSAQEIDRLSLIGGVLSISGNYSTEDLNYFACIRSDSENRTWICADNGLGYLDENGQVTVTQYSGFDSSMEYMYEDYQGNLWFASSRCGVMKLSVNRFTNLFTQAGLDSKVVNAVVEYNGCYYCGTDDGLVILKKDTLESLTTNLTRRLNGIRIRSLLVDSNENLWIATYSTLGLVCLDKDGSLTLYNVALKGTVCDRFRCIIELSDGTIAAGASDGINFIKDGEITGAVTEADGLANPQILCLLEGSDGTLYAGTDGGGICRIRDGKITDTITTENGLTSDVILRLTAYDDGIFVVSSNCLCWLDGDTAAALDAFPYFNNYDLLIYEESAYVLSGSGIYQVNAADLKENIVSQYTLHNPNDGLLGALTSNSWCWLDESGTLYFCCNNGVQSLPLDQKSQASEYKFGIASVTVDGEEITPDDDGVYFISAQATRVSIKASLRNFSLQDVKMRFYIEGLDQEPEVLFQSELTPIVLTNLSCGIYPIHIQVLDNDGSTVLQEQVVTMEKEARFWENPRNIVLLVIVGVFLVAFVTWGILTMINTSRRKKELEIQQKKLEETVAAQTAEIRRQAEHMTNFQWSVIESMARLIENRDGSTGVHVINTRNYVAVLARELLRRRMYPETIDQTFVDYLIRVAPLHDVGKIRISDVILNKPGRFTPEEFEQMKLHAAYGGEVVEQILGTEADPQMLQLAKDVANYHHERWDGGGYPTGLSGESIPLSARIMALADVFDALVAKRVYKDPVPPDKAFEIIKEESGTHFDPVLDEVFLECREEILKVFTRTGGR